MLRKYIRKDNLPRKGLNIRLTVKLEDLKDVRELRNTAPEISMLGQYGFNVSKLVEEMRVKLDGFDGVVRVRLRIERDDKGDINIKCYGVESSYLLKSEIEEKGYINLLEIYNIARYGMNEDAEEGRLRGRCRDIIGTVRSMKARIVE